MSGVGGGGHKDISSSYIECTDTISLDYRYSSLPLTLIIQKY